jgi:hypothetical protein
MIGWIDEGWVVWRGWWMYKVSPAVVVFKTLCVRDGCEFHCVTTNLKLCVMSCWIPVIG